MFVRKAADLTFRFGDTLVVFSDESIFTFTFMAADHVDTLFTVPRTRSIIAFIYVCSTKHVKVIGQNFVILYRWIWSEYNVGNQNTIFYLKYSHNHKRIFNSALKIIEKTFYTAVSWSQNLKYYSTWHLTRKSASGTMKNEKFEIYYYFQTKDTKCLALAF